MTEREETTEERNELCVTNFIGMHYKLNLLNCRGIMWTLGKHLFLINYNVNCTYNDQFLNIYCVALFVYKISYVLGLKVKAAFAFKPSTSKGIL